MQQLGQWHAKSIENYKFDSNKCFTDVRKRLKIIKKAPRKVLFCRC